MKPGSILVLVVIVVAAFLFWADWFGLRGVGPDDDAAPESAPAEPAASVRDAEAKAPVPVVVLEGALRVNGADLASVGTEAPIWVELSLHNVSDELTVNVPGAPTLIWSDAGGPREIAHRPLLVSGTSMTPRGNLRLAWIVEEELAPGTYDVSLSLTPESASAVPIAARVAPARLVLGAAPEIEAVAARYRRRIEVMEGDRSSAIEELRRKLAASPDDLTARLELADLLATSGDLEGARTELNRLLRALPAGEEPPAWLAVRLERLNAAGEQR